MEQGGTGGRRACRLVDHWARLLGDCGMDGPASRPSGSAALRPRSGRNSGSSRQGGVETPGQPGMSLGVGMEVVGLDGQPARVEAVVGVGRVDDLRLNPRRVRGFQQAPDARPGRWAARRGGSAPRRSAPPRPAVVRHGPIDPRQDLAMARLEYPLVLLRVPVPLDPAEARTPGRAANRSPGPGPARSGASARPSRRRPRSTRRSPGRAASASRPARSGTNAGRANDPARRSR